MLNKNVIELTGVRGVAVTLVIYAHWVGYPRLINRFLTGELGVVIFFVLSGFLITRILIDNKQNSQNIGLSLKNFYIKRLLRIFPIYYLFIIYLLIFQQDLIGDTAKWHFAYLSNVYMVLIRHDVQGSISHLWSLSVEEQFYIFWPLLILYAPRQNLKLIVVLTILIGPIFRLFNFNNNILHIYLTPSNFDALGIGALLALYEHRLKKITPSQTYILVSAIVITFVLSGILDKFIPNVWLRDTFRRLDISIFSGLLLAYLLTPKASLLKKILKFKPLVFIGTISYGLYIYHYTFLLLEIDGVSLFSLQIIWTISLLILATASYYIIEKPILNLKRKFT